MKIIVELVILSCHVVFASIGTRKVLQTIIFDNKKKLVNIILLWIIPFLWYRIILTILKPTPGSAEFSDEEKHESNQFYESGIGAPGAGLRDR